MCVYVCVVLCFCCFIYLFRYNVCVWLLFVVIYVYFIIILIPSIKGNQSSVHTGIKGFRVDGHMSPFFSLLSENVANGNRSCVYTIPLHL